MVPEKHADRPHSDQLRIGGHELVLPAKPQRYPSALMRRKKTPRRALSPQSRDGDQPSPLALRPALNERRHREPRRDIASPEADPPNTITVNANGTTTDSYGTTRDSNGNITSLGPGETVTPFGTVEHTDGSSDNIDGTGHVGPQAVDLGDGSSISEGRILYDDGDISGADGTEVLNGTRYYVDGTAIAADGTVLNGPGGTPTEGSPSNTNPGSDPEVTLTIPTMIPMIPTTIPIIAPSGQRPRHRARPRRSRRRR